MSGWILWVVAGIFENIGVVQEGMETISRPNLVIDRADSQAARRAPRARSASTTSASTTARRWGPARRGQAASSTTCRSHIAPGEKVGLVGRSGAGKSTLVNLLLRFYDLEAGRILIDGQDIAHVTQDSLRAQIGMVTQDTSLLHRSVRDNILYGRPDAGEDGRHRGRQARAGRRLHRHARGSARPQGLRRPRRRARREAVRRPAPARRHRPRAPEERADPGPRRGDQRARLGGGDSPSRSSSTT